MNEEIYEVTHDEYHGFMLSLIPSAIYSEEEYTESYNKYIIKSKKTNEILCYYKVYEEEPTQYYIVNIPNDERTSDKPIKKIVLTEKEDV